MGNMSKTVAAKIRARMQAEGATKQEIDAAIKAYYKDVHDNIEYVRDLMRDQYRGRYAPRNEKSNATMRILYDEDE